MWGTIIGIFAVLFWVFVLLIIGAISHAAICCLKTISATPSVMNPTEIKKQ